MQQKRSKRYRAAAEQVDRKKAYSLNDAVATLKRAGAQRIRFLCLVTCPEGARRMQTEHSDVPVYAAALDRQLNDKGYILPGLGDAGDRLFGTR